MNKTTIVALCMLLYGFVADAQITKGNWMMGGDASYYQESYIENGESKNIYRKIDLEPNVAYFLYDKIATGINLNVIFTKDKNLSTDRVNMQNVYKVGPFMRYYFLDTDNKINLFTGAGASYAIQTSRSQGSHIGEFRSISYSFSAGTVVFLNTSIGMEFLLAYNNSDAIKIDSRDKTFQFRIGFQIHLEKDTNE
ncbi:MAG: hypothetical protein M9933_08575 [Chitinophagaceae bacterium]|nr:hypothetical protein [Chitinophagaceae bacterium]